MITRRSVMEGVAGLLFAHPLFAQGTGPSTKVVFTHDVPDLTIKNWSATAVEVSYAPGASSAAHRHPGITIAYVLEGEIRSKVGDEPEKTYTAGQMFLETPGQIHAVSRNASATRPAKLLAILLAEKNSQLTSPAQDR